jgi:hypothetical protein
MALAARGLDVVVGVEEQRRGARTGAEPLAEDVGMRVVEGQELDPLEARGREQPRDRFGAAVGPGPPGTHPPTRSGSARARSARRCGLRGSARARRARRRCPAASRAALRLPIGSHPAWSRSILSPPRPSALVPPRGVRRAAVPSGAATRGSYPQVARNAGAAARRRRRGAAIGGTARLPGGACDTLGPSTTAPSGSRRGPRP